MSSITKKTLAIALRLKGERLQADGNITGAFRLYRLACAFDEPPPLSKCDSSETVTS